MSKHDGGGAAYPCKHTPDWMWSTGLTKRELIAAMVLQGIWACGSEPEHASREELACMATRQADALLSELAKEGGE